MCSICWQNLEIYVCFFAGEKGVEHQSDGGPLLVLSDKSCFAWVTIGCLLNFLLLPGHGAFLLVAFVGAHAVLGKAKPNLTT